MCHRETSVSCEWQMICGCCKRNDNNQSSSIWVHDNFKLQEISIHLRFYLNSQIRCIIMSYFNFCINHVLSSICRFHVSKLAYLNSILITQPNYMRSPTCTPIRSPLLSSKILNSLDMPHTIPNKNQLLVWMGFQMENAIMYTVYSSKTTCDWWISNYNV